MEEFVGGMIILVALYLFLGRAGRLSERDKAEMARLENFDWED